MRDLDTSIDGSPGSIRAVSRWLRDDFGASADDVATSVFRQRSRAASDWHGEAGAAFEARSTTLATAADAARTITGRVAAQVDDLAHALQTAQDSMSAVLSGARAGGLTVTGLIVRAPGPAPAEAGPSPAPDSPAAEHAAWQRADQAVLDHNELVEAWNAANQAAGKVFERWAQALTDAAATWQKHDTELVGVSADFLTAAAEITLISKTVPVLVGQAAEFRNQASRLRGHAEAFKGPGGTVLDPRHYYDLLDEADDLDRVRAPQAYHDAVKFEIPKGIGRTLGILGGAATLYGIHEDIQDGESATQATVSNVAGFGASIVAGAYIGGAIGTAIPVPVLGTVTGVVVGAVAGTVVGAFTSGMIDSVWENGMDSLGDAGGAVMDGLGAVGDTGAAVGDLAGDAWDAIF